MDKHVYGLYKASPAVKNIQAQSHCSIFELRSTLCQTDLELDRPFWFEALATHQDESALMLLALAGCDLKIHLRSNVIPEVQRGVSNLGDMYEVE